LLDFSFNGIQLSLIASDLFVVVCYLTTHPVLRLCSISDRMINAYGAVGIIKIGGGNQSTREKPYLRTSMSITNPAWPDLELNRSWRGRKPVTKTPVMAQQLCKDGYCCNLVLLAYLLVFVLYCWIFSDSLEGVMFCYLKAEIEIMVMELKHLIISVTCWHFFAVHYSFCSGPYKVSGKKTNLNL
jgi:hypothetical protein